MWIAFAVVMMLDGSVTAGAATFDTEQECREANTAIIAKAKEHPGVSKYHLECVKTAKFFTEK